MSDKYGNLEEVAAAFRELPGVVSVAVEERTVVMVTVVEEGSKEERHRVYDKEAEVMDRFSDTPFEFRVVPQVTITTEDFKRKGPLIDPIGKNQERRIVTKQENHERRIDPDKVVEALCAEIVPASLQQEVRRRLRSSGGRPALEGAHRRKKIPLTDSDWKQLNDLAESLQISPGQVASLLLHRILKGSSDTPEE